MARKIEAVAAFSLSPCREELLLMVTEFPLYSVRAVLSGGETCGHHPDAPRLNPGRAVARFVASMGVRVVICADYVEATDFSTLLPAGVACLAQPPRAAFAVPAFTLAPEAVVDSEDASSSSTRMFCAESRAYDVFRAIAFHDAVHEGGGEAGEDPCAICLLGRGVENPSAWCSTGACHHRFHVACILKLLEVRGSCPMGASENVFIRTRHA